ncbi:organic solvent tolerance protein, partial [Candidatus Termititenax persephonae]
MSAIPEVPAAPTVSRTISIEADSVNYVNENKYTSASGNVIVIHGDTTLRAESLTVNPTSKEINITDSFILNRGRQQIYGTSLVYDYGSSTAAGSDVGIELRNNRIKGRNVTILEDKIEIEDAYQTTCTNLLNPCNHITSKRMTIYPEWGDVVNDHAVVYVFFLP